MSPTIAEIMSRIPTAFVPAHAEGLNAVVHFKFTGAEAGEWNAVVKDGKCEVAQGIPHSRPSITVTADSAICKGILAGETDVTRAFMEGKLRVTGDTQLAMRILKLFQLR
jgi:putative sterol carrier protein